MLGSHAAVDASSQPEEEPPRAEGTRTVEGDCLPYDLYGPADAAAGVLFLHGFAGGRAALSHHARRIASRGAAALAVDLSSLTRGGSFHDLFVKRAVRSAQLRNVRQVVDHAAWFGKQPLAIVGHSAGGALALEAAVALQKAGRAPAAVVLLDAVPWAETCEAAAEFDMGASRLISIRAEPSAWNMNGHIEDALRRVPSAGASTGLVDLQVSGACHGDAMEPNWKLRALGLLGQNQEVWGQLLDAYLCEALRLPGAGASPRGEARALLQELRSRARLQVLRGPT